MSPEAPGNLVAVDLQLKDGELIGRQERVEPEHEWLRVSWYSKRQPQDYFPVAGGVAYVHRASPEIKIQKSTASPDSLGNSRYSWRDVARGDGLMFILVLPEGYTLSEPEPMPMSAKVFKKRLALYWMPQQSCEARTIVTWRLKKFEGDLRTEAERINTDAKAQTSPSHGGVFVEKPQPSPPVGRGWVKNLVTLIVLLAFGLAGLYFLSPFAAMLWFLFVLVATPVVLAFVQSSETIQGMGLLELYRTGVAQLPFIGELLARLFVRR